MVEAAQSIAASEARAVGINWTFAPMVDIARATRAGVASSKAPARSLSRLNHLGRSRPWLQGDQSAVPIISWLASNTSPAAARRRRTRLRRREYLTANVESLYSAAVQSRSDAGVGSVMARIWT